MEKNNVKKLEINGMPNTNIIKKNEILNIKKIKKKNKKWEKMEQEPILWRKIIFPISQLSGKIKKVKFNKQYLHNSLTDDDINLILKLIYQESSKFSPVKKNTKNKILFFIICSIFLFFGCYFCIKKLVFPGIVLICLFFLTFLFYCWKIKKKIQIAYKKCRQKLFFVTDFINRKFLGKFGLYITIDSILRFIAIYRVPKHVKQMLEYRDEQIEYKKQFEGRTINELHDKKEYTKNINIFNNININKSYYFNENNENSNLQNLTKIKYNNFFKNENCNNKKTISDSITFNNINDKTIDEIDKNVKLEEINFNIKKGNKNSDFDSDAFKKELLKKVSLNKTERSKNNYNNGNKNKGELFHERSQSKSIDIFMDYLESKNKGLGLVTNFYNKKFQK